MFVCIIIIDNLFDRNLKRSRGDYCKYYLHFLPVFKILLAELLIFNIIIVYLALSNKQ